MKRYPEIEKIIASGKLSDEEILVLNEATLMKNIFESQKKGVKSQHDTITLPIKDKNGKYIRRVGIWDKKAYRRQDVDVVLVEGVVHDERFLIISDQCAGAKIFEDDPIPGPSKQEIQGDKKTL